MEQARLACKAFVMLLSCSYGASFLVYPASTSLGLTASVSVPVTEFYPERRINIDWCFGVSYDLPKDVSSFYNIPIWPGFANYHTKRDLRRVDPDDHWMYEKYGYQAQTHTHPKDFSAGELYANIEDALASYGFHETCLLRSVCELAAHPFDDQFPHMLSDILTFVLSPSQHDGFLESEQVYRQVYEQAELNGILGKDCAQLYAYCKHDILRLVSSVTFPH